jgi:hypothetical protein
MDIEKIEIRRLLSGEEGIEPYPLDSRLLGGPHAGTKESILLRPIGTNAIGTVTTLAYDITITYRKAVPPLPVDDLDKEDFDLLDTEGGDISIKFGKDQEGDMAVLPRGKTIVHFYRTESGEIEITIADPTEQANLIDYVQNVTVIDNASSVNLGSIEVALTSLPEVTVDFSDEVKELIAGLHIKLQDIKDAIDAVAASTVTAADVIANAIIKGNSPYGDNYSVFIVQNWTDRPVSEIILSADNNGGTGDSGDLVASDSNGIIPILNNAATGQKVFVLENGKYYRADVTINDREIVYRGFTVPGQKYLHVYETTTGYGLYASEVEFGTVLASGAIYNISIKYQRDEFKYGRIEVQNYSSVKLAGIGFFKRDDSSANFVIRDIKNGGGNTRAEILGAPEIFNPGKSMSEGVLAGDYFITVMTEDGRYVMVDHATTIHAEAFTSSIDNKIYIFEDDIARLTPVINNWTVTANGGPTAAQSDPAYDTTLLTFTFDSDPGSAIQIAKLDGDATIGSLTRTSPTTFTMQVTTIVPPQENLHLTATAANVEPGPKGVVVYKHTAQTGVVTTRYFYKNSGVTNTMPLARHTSHELHWYLDYEEVTYTDGNITARTPHRLNNFGSFAIDNSNDTVGSDSDNDYVRFRQDGSWGNPNASTRTASLRVGTFVSGTYMANDKAPRNSGQWDLYTGLDFNADLSALDIVIENMPHSKVPLYIWGFEVGEVTKVNYLPVTLRIQNKNP